MSRVVTDRAQMSFTSVAAAVNTANSMAAEGLRKISLVAKSRLKLLVGTVKMGSKDSKQCRRSHSFTVGRDQV